MATDDSITKPLAPTLAPAPGAASSFWLAGRTQASLLGLVCFCVPGMWNSITSMAGGITDTSHDAAGGSK